MLIQWMNVKYIKAQEIWNLKLLAKEYMLTCATEMSICGLLRMIKKCPHGDSECGLTVSVTSWLLYRLHCTEILSTSLFLKLSPTLLLHSNKYRWENILRSLILVHRQNNFCWSLCRDSQIVHFLAKILNQLRNKTKKKGRWEAKMSQVLLTVQISLMARKFVLSLGSTFFGTPRSWEALFSTVGWEQVSYLHLQTRSIQPPIHIPSFSFALLVGRMEIFRDPRGHVLKRAEQSDHMKESHPLTWTPALYR